MPDLVLQRSTELDFRDNESIRHLKQALANGENWYLALLEAVQLWNVAEETFNGQTYHYLIEDEALDWPLLIERLIQTVDTCLPIDEKDALLFQLKPPIKINQSKFKELNFNHRENRVKGARVILSQLWFPSCTQQGDAII